MHLVLLFVQFVVVCVLLVLNHRRRILSPRELLWKAYPLEVVDMVILSQASTGIKNDYGFYQQLWISMGKTIGLFIIAYNAGCIVSTARFFMRLHPEKIQSEYLELCHQAAELRFMAFWAIPEIILNACGIRYPRLHAHRVAYLYSQISIGIRTQFEVFCPDLLPNLGQVL